MLSSREMNIASATSVPTRSTLPPFRVWPWLLAWSLTECKKKGIGAVGPPRSLGWHSPNHLLPHKDTLHSARSGKEREQA